MRSGRGLGAVLVVALVVGGCAVNGSGPPTPTDLTPSGSTATPSPVLPTASAPTNLPTVDRALLAVLPAKVDGIAIEESPEAEATALTDPMLPLIGSSLAAGIAFDGANGDFVYGVVVRLTPGAPTDDLFAAWRRSYDAGACSQADGLVGTTTSLIGGRLVHIGTCKGGLLTYHVWIKEKGILVAASAVGARRLGERLMGSLRP